MSERFFRSNRSEYPHPESSELEISGIRVAVGDCSVTERQRWRPPYQTGKTVHVNAKHYKHYEDGRTAPGVCGNGSVPLIHSGSVVTRIGIHMCVCIPILVSWYPGPLDRKNRSDMCLRWESNPRLPACKASTLSTRPGSPLWNTYMYQCHFVSCAHSVNTSVSQ